MKTTESSINWLFEWFGWVKQITVNKQQSNKSLWINGIKIKSLIKPFLHFLRNIFTRWLQKGNERWLCHLRRRANPQIWSSPDPFVCFPIETLDERTSARADFNRCRTVGWLSINLHQRWIFKNFSPFCETDKF